MNITMNDKHIVNISQIKEFAKINNIFEFKINNKKEKYEWINNVLNKFKYFSLRKKDKGIVRKYIKNMTGLKDSQLTVLINKKRNVGVILLSLKKKHTFPLKYYPFDVALLSKTDNLHLRPCAPCVKAMLERECNVFNKKEYANLSNISISHIYNLRKRRQYLSSSSTFEKTCAVSIKIGERSLSYKHGG